MELPQPVINDGFGPQLKGNVTMAQIFDGEVELSLTEDQQQQQAIRQSIPDRLKREILAFKTKVNKNTPIVGSSSLQPASRIPLIIPEEPL